VGGKGFFFYFGGGGGGYYIGSQVNYILDALKKENINITLNKKAVYFMLTYACMADDSTYANEIKRLPAGHYIQIENGQISINEYWSLQKNRYNLTGYSDDEIIEQLDQKFRSAIKLEYDKDNEYNYRHITDLSGGLDSRMNTWVAHDMGFTDIVNITYSQSNYLDENIAKKVARYLHNELIFKQLDDVSFIYDIDEMVNMNYGTCLYCGLTGGKRLFDCLNFQAFGVKHTGALGDVILGSYLHNAGDLNKKYLDGQCSGRLNLKVEKKHLDKYADHELYMMNVRGFLGILSSNFVYQNYTEMSSPFLDVDFLEYCFSIPIEKRIKHYIYQKWILKKYPEAAGFKWEAINSKITMNKYLRLFKNFLRNKFRGFLRRANLNSIMSNTSMNPFDYWYAKNENNIRDFILKYYNDKLYVVMDDDIRKDMQELFNKGSTIEKTLVLTALASIKFYFHNRM
jgi:asparagine synthase (glutamine-hydrolysing)